VSLPLPRAGKGKTRNTGFFGEEENIRDGLRTCPSNELIKAAGGRVPELEGKLPSHHQEYHLG